MGVRPGSRREPNGPFECRFAGVKGKSSTFSEMPFFAFRWMRSGGQVGYTKQTIPLRASGRGMLGNTRVTGGGSRQENDGALLAKV